MTNKIDYDNVDKVINRFYSYLPHGNEYSDSVYDFKFEYNEQQSILKFLKEQSILIAWGDHGKLIISPKGEEIATVGIEKYLEHEKEVKAIKLKLENITNEKLVHDAKVAKWHYQTYWWVFGATTFCTIYTIYTIINGIFFK